MYIIAGTIKMKFLTQILNGYKLREYKATTPHWDKRIAKANIALAAGQDVFISFLCGKDKHHTFRVDTEFIEKIRTPDDVRDTVTTPTCYEIPLGEKVDLTTGQLDEHRDGWWIYPSKGGVESLSDVLSWLEDGEKVYVVRSEAGIEIRRMTEVPKHITNDPVPKVGDNVRLDTPKGTVFAKVTGRKTVYVDAPPKKEDE